MRKPAFRTARCILRQRDVYLLVVHRSARPGAPERWGLPGGRVNPREAPEATVRRELREELRITLGALVEVGDYRYKGFTHKVLGAVHEGTILAFDRREILRIGWHTLDAVAALAREGRLHAGFEEAAIRDFTKLGVPVG